MAGVVRRAHEEEEGEEFDEGEVWDVLHDQSKEAAAAAALSRKGAKSRQQHEEGGGGGAARRSGKKGRPSAPVAIPAAGCSSRRGGGGGDDDDDEEEEMMQLPPHEWLARKMERMSAVSSPDQIGGGRSKGREMRKVRDAVLPKTAFSSEHQ
ncbi:hypothetical protein GUJ93_ZPchr0007g4339 [Zizania palustris]|uniref:Uncharacterized protein n=1 Tax=Zizania palustris TaxID=103762 RepID=A0A8J5T5Q3_ZIZPA|nr:hypothetical protein GUJ93_ZPchr0007g5941 [Zizania palustris]KAG8080399.1 hypothetical protein GUJ93_ZPchr0007g4339 [Zizania palustris]